MHKLKIKSTAKTPEVHFDLTGKLEISGVSVPENSMGFYKELIDWVKEYSKNPADKTVMVFRLDYINTSSLQFVYDLLSILATIHGKLSVVSVDWHYEEGDSDLKETGEDYDESIAIPFKFIEVAEV